jgi:hypothetical protein
MSKLPGSFGHKPGLICLWHSGHNRTAECQWPSQGYWTGSNGRTAPSFTIITNLRRCHDGRATFVRARAVHPQKSWITLGIMGSRNRHNGRLGRLQRTAQELGDT